MPPPSSGGVALLEMFHVLERFDLAAMKSDTVRTDHLLVETMRRAFADRAEFAGDPDFVKVPVASLTSKKYADEIASTIDLDRATPSSQIGHGKPVAYESPETTHFSVVDSEGNAVSNTYTLNMGYGCGVTVKGAGFLLNNEMDDFAAKPGTPNGFGLIQGEANAIAPHKRPLSSMTPTFLLKNGRLLVVIGSPGGPTIITTVFQTLVHVIDHGMSLEQAIAAPRLHHQWMPDEIRIERAALTGLDRKKLEAMGHKFPAKASEQWGDVEGIQWDQATGQWLGVTDPRSPDAGAVGY
jgi:gamma-glutamyltranspeptidase/glutathione hydrolase